VARRDAVNQGYRTSSCDPQETTPRRDPHVLPMANRTPPTRSPSAACLPAAVAAGNKKNPKSVDDGSEDKIKDGSERVATDRPAANGEEGAPGLVSALKSRWETMGSGEKAAPPSSDDADVPRGELPLTDPAPAPAEPFLSAPTAQALSPDSIDPADCHVKIEGSDRGTDNDRVLDDDELDKTIEPDRVIPHAVIASTSESTWPAPVAAVDEEKDAMLVYLTSLVEGPTVKHSRLQASAAQRNAPPLAKAPEAPLLPLNLFSLGSADLLNSSTKSPWKPAVTLRQLSRAQSGSF
jgi:hypothetical protein